MPSNSPSAGSGPPSMQRSNARASARARRAGSGSQRIASRRAASIRSSTSPKFSGSVWAMQSHAQRAASGLTPDVLTQHVEGCRQAENGAYELAGRDYTVRAGYENGQLVLLDMSRNYAVNG